MRHNLQSLFIKISSFGLFSSVLQIIFVSPFVFAHGENQLGPHQGYIRMPGVYHTEIVEVAPSEFEVYLLDMNWKNPVTANSFVKAEFRLGSEKAKDQKEVECQPRSDRFVCRLPSGDPFIVSKKLGKKIILRTKRQNQLGSLAEYAYPFMLVKHGDDHSKH